MLASVFVVIAVMTVFYLVYNVTGMIKKNKNDSWSIWWHLLMQDTVLTALDTHAFLGPLSHCCKCFVFINLFRSYKNSH